MDLKLYFLLILNLILTVKCKIPEKLNPPGNHTYIVGIFHGTKEHFHCFAAVITGKIAMTSCTCILKFTLNRPFEQSYLLTQHYIVISKERRHDIVARIAHPKCRILPGYADVIQFNLGAVRIKDQFETAVISLPFSGELRRNQNAETLSEQCNVFIMRQDFIVDTARIDEMGSSNACFDDYCQKRNQPRCFSYWKVKTIQCTYVKGYHLDLRGSPLFCKNNLVGFTSVILPPKENGTDSYILYITRLDHSEAKDFYFSLDTNLEKLPRANSTKNLAVSINFNPVLILLYYVFKFITK